MRVEFSIAFDCCTASAASASAICSSASGCRAANSRYWSISAPIRSNVTLATLGQYLSRLGLIDFAAERATAQAFRERLNIRARDVEMAVGVLSAGNQQKVILARWLAIDPSFLILDEPTRGIDVGAHAEIVRTINRLREEGLALLVISSELDEVVAYSNRVVVMRDRAMVAELHGTDIAPSVIVAAIAENTAATGGTA